MQPLSGVLLISEELAVLGLKKKKKFTSVPAA
jgi:hypothetical protein